MEPLIFPQQPELAEPMARYMKNLFPFCGVKKPQRALLERPFLKESLTLPLPELIQEIFRNYHKDEREYQYYAIDLAQKNIQRFSLADLAELLPLLAEKSWWDSIDAWRKVFATWVLAHPTELKQVYAFFYQHENFWYRRIAINLQLLFKEQTDPALLAQAILADLTTEEFFIQKAIGWALRDYSKVNPDWVKNFMQQHSLSKLALREGSKYI
ncbi:DNA alkylation repair protein [Enterococcus hulanensis]|uniref:DNA alkylation repair protein n=1 Tax=Enterococcus hulanensis TaxID=2559929 RepID=A0ABU3EZ46_9ENTE|nr:DNA alkylation repair protein [Enterococcus hulanensis]MDT2600148.1 DNA alkylation repair protein [Enterococcus hulanensis]MDT2608961.1 DNA alkylation repair protein [Enterococcus hulanensis]MDT2616997.1 DNA alkylation repair protein [Enterococcus hulanensis]MDT2628483.1 DNA alkylation repair protein [Enterococcus hulanensis]MDT2655823.1 DNA alkylation repair protein [Enterococcus hulanensis]